MQSQFDAEFWRERADEARSLAQAMGDPSAKRHMHFIAEAYERLADYAERTGPDESVAGTIGLISTLTAILAAP